ncbi:MAG: response regulator transcription factor [Limisphaerales bacterium]
MLSPHAWTAIARKCRLSPRELQIVRGIFENHTDHAIGSSLGISRHTIHTYLSRLFRKLNATTRTQVVLRIMQQFLILSSSTERKLPALCWRSHTCPHSASNPDRHTATSL